MGLVEVYLNEFRDINGFFYENIYLVVMFFAGVIFVFAGAAVSSYSTRSIYFKRLAGKKRNYKWVNALDYITSVYPAGIIKKEINNSLSIIDMEEENFKLFSNMIIIALASLSFLNIFLLRNVGQLWYVKILLIIVSLFLPYYVMTLAFDLYKQYLNRHIPHMIDEFRGAFIKHRKIKPALKECCQHIDGKLGRIILRAAEAPYVENSLAGLKDRLDNIWFNIFVTLIINYKSNGGELIDQLYKLNKTMTRYINIEKKKSKRLVWYEIFAVAAAVFSIPAIFWLNTAIMGPDMAVIIDAESNVIISRIIAFSILSLVVVRVLRKL